MIRKKTLREESTSIGTETQSQYIALTATPNLQIPTIMLNLTSWKAGALAVLAAAGLIAPAANAGQRHYAFTYETLTAPKGSFELENWVTWEHIGKNDNSFQFRHEIEYGVTDRLELSLYFADWSVNERDGHRTTNFDNVALEAIYNLTNPNTDFLGSSIYGEVTVGDDVTELEGKILLEKRFGRFGIAYNGVLEAVWEGEHRDERTGEFSQSVGASYDISKSFSMGAEALHEIEMPDWGSAEPGRFWVGPNASFRSGRFYATLSALWQTTNADGEPTFLPRLIVGYTF
jgi:hypothetical protein